MINLDSRRWRAVGAVLFGRSLPRRTARLATVGAGIIVIDAAAYTTIPISIVFLYLPLQRFS
jgi:hypothetical protein